MSNFCPNASDPQSVGVSSKDKAQRQPHCCTSSHSQPDTDDLSDDHETSSGWTFEGNIYFGAGRWPAAKTYENTIRAAVEKQYLPTVPVPVHRMEFFTIRRPAEPDRERAGKIASRRQWRKGKGAAALDGWSGKRSRAEFSYMKCTYLNFTGQPSVLFAFCGHKGSSISRIS